MGSTLEAGQAGEGAGRKAHQGVPRGWLSFPTVGRCGRSCHTCPWREQAYVPGLEETPGRWAGPPSFRAEEGSDAWVSPVQNHRSVCLDFIAPAVQVRLTQKPPVKKGESRRDSKPIAGSVNSAAREPGSPAQGQERGGRRRSFSLEKSTGSHLSFTQFCPL